MLQALRRNWFYVIFLVITLVAAGLRLYKLGSIPVSLYWDEVAISIDARSISQTGKDMHSRPWYQVLYPSYGDYKLPGYIWLAGATNLLVGSSDFSTRLPSSLAGVGTVIVAGLLARQLTGSRKNQLATMFVVAVAPWSVMFSRTAFEGHLAQFLLASSVLMLLKAFSEKKHIYLMLAVALGSLATYTYFSVRFIWFLVLGLVFIYKLKDQKLVFSQLAKKTIVYLLIPGLLYALLLKPMFDSPLYAVSNQYRFSTQSIFNSLDYPLISNHLRELAGNTFLDRLYFHRHLLLIKELASNIADHFAISYLFMTGDSNLRHGTGEHGVYLVSFLPLLAIGIYKLVKNKPSTILLLLLWWLGATIPASVPMETPHALRSLNALVPSSIIIGVGLTELVSWLKQKNVTSKVAGSYLFLVVLSAILFTDHYFTQYKIDSVRAWQDGYPQLTKEVLALKDQVFEVRVLPSEERLNLWLLAYGPFSAQQIQSMPREDFTFKEIDNIIFGYYDWQRLNTIDHKVAIIGEIDPVRAGMASVKVEPAKVITVKNSNNQDSFLIAIYNSI